MARSYDTSVRVPIEADNKPIKETLKETTTAIETEAKKWDRTMENTGDSMEKSFTRALDINRLKDWALQAGKAMLDFGLSCINAASDLEEVQNVVDVTFEDSANQINSWAKQAITQFGLSETRAKQFASTLGAMMKSAGLEGNEIVKMSEDLAGLAADMSSFYNIDFDTAFMKIRSGLSGETEPLKQLGVNMSVANLEAFALQQGITKAFDKMSQGEQTILRYQYLMQATADAQGDFARTSDGYANGLRLFESNLESIKTMLGQAFVPVLADATSKINDFLALIVTPKPTTVLDEFAEIDLKTEEKLAEIEQTAQKAGDLVSTLKSIESSTSISGIGLDSFIETLSGNIGGLDDAVKKAKQGDLTGALDSLADKLTKDFGGSPDEWKKLLGAISENLPAVTNATLSDSDQTAAWLEAAAAAADDLGGDYSTLWSNLLGALGDKAGAAVTALANGSGTGAIVEAIAKGANVLNAGSASTWESLLGTLQSVNGLENIFTSGAGQNVKDLAEALSGASPDKTKAEAWKEFLDALGTNADALTALTGTSAEDTKEWLETIATAAGTLENDDAKGWNKLLGAVVQGLPGLQNTEAGKQFFETMSANFLAMGNESEEAKNGLLALGFSTDEIADKQAVWLETCKRLVQTIPGLSSIINTETGEVKGGVEAVESYIKAWKDGMMEIAYMEALQDKRQAYANALKEQATIKLNLDVNTPQYRGIEEEYQKLKKARDDAEAELAKLINNPRMLNSAEQKAAAAARDAAAAAFDSFMNTGRNREIIETQHQLEAQLEASSEAAAEAAKDFEDTKKAMEEMGYAADGTASSVEGVVEELTAEEITAATDAITEAQKALKNLKDYSDQAYQSALKTVQGSLSAFTAPKTAQQQVADLEAEIQKWNASAHEASEKNPFEATYKAAKETEPEIGKMNAALEAQIKYLDEYMNNLAEMRKKGYSDEVIAMVSDGSVQSASYAAALANTSAGDTRIKEINDNVKELHEKEEELARDLAENQLKVDDTAKALTDSWEQAVAKVNQYVAAEENASNTLQGVIDGLTDETKKQALRDAVDDILDMLGELNGAGNYGLNITTPDIWSNGGGGNTMPDIKVYSTLRLNEKVLGESMDTYFTDQYNQTERSGVIRP